MEPLAPHEKIYVDSEIAEDEFHGELSCDACHGGNPNDPNWKTAHEGVVKDPSYPDAVSSCGQCHEDIAEHYASSLHMGLASFKKVTEKRLGSNPAMQDKLTQARAAHCGGCHSSCGQCHISRPESVEGGLLDLSVQSRPDRQGHGCGRDERAVRIRGHEDGQGRQQASHDECGAGGGSFGEMH